MAAMFSLMGGIMSNKDKHVKELNMETTGKDNATTTTKKRTLKPNKIDEAMLLVAKEHPEWNPNQIGKKLKDLGVLKCTTTPYKRLTKSAFLRGEFAEIKKANAEMMSREIVPEALKIHKEVLKDKDIPAIQKKDWVIAAEKMEFKPDIQNLKINETINVDQLSVYQQIVHENLGSTADKKYIDVTGTETNNEEEGQ